MADQNISPAAAFSGSLDDFLFNQQAAKHQALLDSIATDREKRLGESEQVDLELRREELKQRREESQEKVKDKRLDNFIKASHELAPGDVPSANLVKEGQELGMPLRLGAAPTIPAGQGMVGMPGPTTMPAPPPGMKAPTPPANPMAPVPMPGAQSPQTMPGGRSYLGSRADIASQKLMDSLPPDSPERKAVEYELATGKTAPAGIFKLAGTDTEPIVRQNPRTGSAERLQNGQWVPVTGDVPKGTHFMTTPTRDPALETLTQLAIADKRKGQSSEGDLSQGAVDMIAEQVAKSGKGASALSGLGWGNASKAEKSKILNRAAEYDVSQGKFRDAGTPGAPPDLASQAADYASLEGTLKFQQRTASTAKVSQKTALDNLDLAAKSSKKVSRTDSAWVNDIANKFVRGATSAEGLTDFEVKIFTAAREYAKVVNGATASVSALSDTAAKEASKILNSSQSDKAFQAAVGAMGADMANFIKRQDEGVEETRKKISGGRGGGEKKKSLDDLWKAAHGKGDD